MGEIAPNLIAPAFGLSDDILASLRRVFSQFSEIERVLIYGSRAKGTFMAGSDIDLALVAANMSDERFSELWNSIDDLPIVFKIDLLHWDRLNNPSLKKAALMQGIQLFP